MSVVRGDGAHGIILASVEVVVAVFRKALGSNDLVNGITSS